MAGRLEVLLYDVEGGDAKTLASVLLATLSVALVAGAGPAVQAVRSDPARALREE